MKVYIGVFSALFACANGLAAMAQVPVPKLSAEPTPITATDDLPQRFFYGLDVKSTTAGVLQ